jgi:hypothetical protein
MDDSKSETALKRVEVVVAVKQRMALSQTESSNKAADRLANMVRSLTPIANQAGFVQVSLPLHFTAEPTNRRLGLCLDQQTQTRFHSSLLSAGAATAHGLVQQLIIDFDIRTHRREPSMCKDRTLMCSAQGLKPDGTRVRSSA